MNQLVLSFSQHQGLRGVHVSSGSDCRFLPWEEVLSFTEMLPKHSDPEFSEKLIGVMANYDPDKEFIVLHQKGDTISIELYSAL